MRRSERAVRTPWRQERRGTRKRGGTFQVPWGTGGAGPTEILHFSSAVGHWALVRCAGLAMGMALGGRRGSRGCQGRTRLRKWLPFYVLSFPPGPLTR